MIVDAHCHAGKGDGLSGPWDTDASLRAYMPRAQRAGIGLTLLIPTFHSDYAAANRQVAAIVARDPRRFLAWAMVHPEHDRGRVASLVADAMATGRCCGIKVHQHDARISREVADVARASRLPVLYDVQGDTASVVLLAREFPDVAWIFPHLGSFADDWRAQVQLIDQLAHHPNVFADTGGVRRFDLLVEAVRRAGPEKLIFGTDGPWLHPGLELAKIKALGLDPAAERLVLGANVLRLIGRRGRGLRARLQRPSTRPRPAPSDPWVSSAPSVCC